MKAVRQESNLSDTVQILLAERGLANDRLAHEEMTQRLVYAQAEENHKKQLLETKTWYEAQIGQMITPAAGKVIDQVLEEERVSREKAEQLQGQLAELQSQESQRKAEEATRAIEAQQQPAFVNRKSATVGEPCSRSTGKTLYSAKGHAVDSRKTAKGASNVKYPVGGSEDWSDFGQEQRPAAAAAASTVVPLRASIATPERTHGARASPVSAASGVTEVPQTTAEAIQAEVEKVFATYMKNDAAEEEKEPAENKRDRAKREFTGGPAGTFPIDATFGPTAAGYPLYNDNIQCRQEYEDSLALLGQPFCSRCSTPLTDKYTNQWLNVS